MVSLKGGDHTHCKKFVEWRLWGPSYIYRSTACTLSMKTVTTLERVVSLYIIKGYIQAFTKQCIYMWNKSAIKEIKNYMRMLGVMVWSHPLTHSHTHIYIYSDGVIYWPYPNFIKSRVYYAHALTLILFQVANSVFFFLIIFYCE